MNPHSTHDKNPPGNAPFLKASNAERAVVSAKTPFWRGTTPAVPRRGIFSLCMTVLLAVCGRAEPLNFFASEDHLVVRADTRFEPGERIAYRIAKDHRTLANGTAHVEADGMARLTVTLPEMMAGVALPLSVTLSHAGIEGEPQKIWAFSQQPPLNVRRKVFLIADDGDTSAAFTSIALDFEVVTSIDQIACLTNALIVVAEDVDCHDTWTSLMSAAELEAEVLVLAPAKDCALTLPRTMTTFSMGRMDILRHAKPAHQLALSELRRAGLRLDVRGDKIALLADEFSEILAAQWTHEKAGRVRVLGVTVIHNWNTTPAARWLLAEIMGDQNENN